VWALVACAGVVSGQITGSILGRVVDPTGAPLPGVTVEATSPSLQGTRASTTSSSGAYRFAALPPGSYRVTATLSGFRSVEKTATVSLDAVATVDLTLQMSAEAQVVVTGEAPLGDSTSTTTGTNYTASVITHLPVSRNYADIVRSNPGVSTDRGATEGRSLALTVYGATSAENQWIIDGVNTTNVFKGVQGKAINNEFVQEVEVKTGGYQAEYGRALGGVVNVITKSGGNEYHGDGFLYYDSTGTAAESQFRPGDSPIAQMRVASGERFDYGVDIGGFIVKDRLWLFGAYNRVTLQGDLSRAEASPHVPTSARFPFDSVDNLYSGKLTWNPAASTTVVGTVFADPSTTSGAAGADPRQGLGIFALTPPVSLEPSTWYSSRTQGGTDFGLRVSQLFGASALATLQGSYHKDRNALSAPEGIRYLDETCQGGTPEARCSLPQEPKNVTGGYGLVNGWLDHSDSSRQQYLIGGTFYAGNHELKGGGDYMDGKTDARSSLTGEQIVRLRNEYGQPYFMHRFFGIDQFTPVPSFDQRGQVLNYGVYVQDSWKLAPNLTVNIGLRWDGEQTLDDAGQTVLTFENAWQPRVGVVWDPWGNGATKVYAFAGRFSYALPTFVGTVAFGHYSGFFTTFNFDPVSVVQDPNVLHHGQAQGNPGGVGGDLVDSGLKGPSLDELTAGIERLITPSLTVGLKGTYRSLRNTLEDRGDFDYNSPETNYNQWAMINPGSSERYASGNAPTCNGLYDDPAWYACYPRGPASPEARRYYRGIELLARQTIGTALWLQASYIYSTLRGNYDGGVNQGVYGQTFPGLNSDFDYPALWHNGYGTLALDRTNRFRFDGYWTSPWRVSVGLQAFAETGAPLNKMGYFNDGYGPLIFLEPRGSVGRLPTLWGANLTLSYPIAIGPATVTLQGYLFNIFNKQIAVDRDNSWSTSAPENFPATIYDPNQEQTNPYYGDVTRRQEPRVFRAAIRVSF
jgi:outer membrane receptor protein involved in Fe transport